VIHYEINKNAYDKPYYVADGTYPDWTTLVKTANESATEKKKMLVKQQVACRKDLERAFGVLWLQS
jgi:hypothetical protein